MIYRCFYILTVFFTMFLNQINEFKGMYNIWPHFYGRQFEPMREILNKRNTHVKGQFVQVYRGWNFMQNFLKNSSDSIFEHWYFCCANFDGLEHEQWHRNAISIMMKAKNMIFRIDNHALLENNLYKIVIWWIFSHSVRNSKINSRIIFRHWFVGKKTVLFREILMIIASRKTILYNIANIMGDFRFN